MQEERLDPAAGRRLVVPLVADVDVMGLHVEDELVLGPVFLEGLGVVDLFGVDLVGIAEDLVERHAARLPFRCRYGGSHGASGPGGWRHVR